MSNLKENMALVDELFQDVNIRRSLRDLCFVLDAIEQSSKVVLPKDMAHDVAATALFQHMTNPFSVVMAPMSRPIILEIMREGGSDYASRFLERIIPLVKTIENESQVRDYFTIHKDVKRRIK